MSTGLKRKMPEDSLASNAIKTPITSKILHHRLLVGLGVKGGSKGSLTKCAVRIGECFKNLDNAGIRDAAIRELEHQKLEMIKLHFMVARSEIELEAIRSKTETLKEKAVAESLSVQEKRKELRNQLAVNACEREYEALAKLAASRHPTSSRVLRNKYDEASRKQKETREELIKAQKEVKIRQSQFQLLMQSLFDLKQSLEEPLEVSGDTEGDGDVEKGEEALESKGEETEESQPQVYDAAGDDEEYNKTDPMDVEQKVSEDEGDDLYSDL